MFYLVRPTLVLLLALFAGSAGTPKKRHRSDEALQLDTDKHARSTDRSTQTAISTSVNLPFQQQYEVDASEAIYVEDSLEAAGRGVAHKTVDGCAGCAFAQVFAAAADALRRDRHPQERISVELFTDDPKSR